MRRIQENTMTEKPNKNKCEKYFDKFLSLDKNEIIPLSVSIHLLLCAKCRTAVRSMSIAEDLLQQDMNEAAGNKSTGVPRKTDKKKNSFPAAESRDPVVAAALSQIADAGLTYPIEPVTGRVSLEKWTVGGIILILCLTFFPFTALGEWGEKVLGEGFSISFYVLTGISIAVYISLFIGSNIDFFVKKIRRIKKLKRKTRTK